MKTISKICSRTRRAAICRLSSDGTHLQGQRHLRRLAGSRRRSLVGQAVSGSAEHCRPHLLRNPFRAALAHAGLLQRGRARFRLPATAHACLSSSMRSRGATSTASRCSSASPSSTRPIGGSSNANCLAARAAAEAPTPNFATLNETLKRRVAEAVAERRQGRGGAPRKARKWKRSAS